MARFIAKALQPPFTVAKQKLPDFVKSKLRKKRQTGEAVTFGVDDPTKDVKRLGVKPTELRLPEPDQFQKLFEKIETSGAGQARHCADFVRFLAYSGCRLSEARHVRWVDVNLDRGFIMIHSAKKRKTTNASRAQRRTTGRLLSVTASARRRVWKRSPKWLRHIRRSCIASTVSVPPTTTAFCQRPSDWRPCRNPVRRSATRTLDALLQTLTLPSLCHSG
jgi:integrase